MRHRELVAILLCVRMIIVQTQGPHTLRSLQEAQASASSSLQTSNPRGLFHYSESDNTFQSNFKVPDFEMIDPIRMASELLSAAAAAENKRKTISGINLPLPFASKPLRFQMTGESRSRLSTSEQGSNKSGSQSDLSPEAKEAFQKAKTICLQSSASSCDEALDTYHRVKFGSSLVDDNPVQHAVDNDPTTSFATMFVPGLEERLRVLAENAAAADAHEDSSDSHGTKSGNDERSLASHMNNRAPDLHPFSNVRTNAIARSREQKIRHFLQRIS